MTQTISARPPESVEHRCAQRERLCSHWWFVVMADAPDVNRTSKRRDEHPRRHTAMRPTHDAGQTTMAERLAWLASTVPSMMGVVYRCSIGAAGQWLASIQMASMKHRARAGAVRQRVN